MRKQVDSQCLGRSSPSGWDLVPDNSFLFPGSSDGTQLPGGQCFCEATDMPPVCGLVSDVHLKVVPITAMQQNGEPVDLDSVETEP